MNRGTGARRALAAFGALACAAAVGLSAYASHGLQGEDAGRVALAALFAALQAPDVALSQLGVSAIVLPVMILLAVAKIREHER